jgi:hypothetical protein
MMKLLIPVLFAIVAFVLFAAALHFSQYKKRKSGCCGGAALMAEYTGKTCDKDQSKYCVCEETPAVEDEK